MSAQQIYNSIMTPGMPVVKGYYQSPTHLNSAKRQFDMDTALWYGAIKHSQTPDEAAFLRRLFGIIFYGGVSFKDKDNIWHDLWGAHGHNNLPVAAMLSHGGRVLVQLPPSSNHDDWKVKPDANLLQSNTRKENISRKVYFDKNKTDRGDFSFWRWLCGSMGSLDNRVISTHGLKIADSPTHLPNNGMLYLKEKKGMTVGTGHSKKHQHYALNVSLGGYGNKSPLSGETVKGDGLDGHLYLLFMPPTEIRCGGMLIGCENAQFGMGENRHTGAGHGAGGAANAVSAAGAFKWKDMSKTDMKGPIPVGKKGDVVVDLTGGMEHIKSLAGKFTEDMLSATPTPAIPGARVRLVPTYDQWQAATRTGGRFAKRSDRLKAIDTHIKMINNNHPTKPHIDQLVNLCGAWISKSRVSGFKNENEGDIDDKIKLLYQQAEQLSQEMV